MRIPYSSVRNGKRYFEPRGAMRAAGFRPRALGRDDEQSRAEALRLFETWKAVMISRSASLTRPELSSPEAASLARPYPRGSIGEAWQRWVMTDEWRRLAPSNRSKIWWPAWVRWIEPVFGRESPNRITMDQMSQWRGRIVDLAGVDAAHKAMKVWRAFWRIMLALRYTQLTDPSAKVTNTAPRPRTVRHAQAGAVLLAKTAWRRGYRGLACIIMVCWDGSFQPGDARLSRARHLGVDPKTGRHVIDRSREKTGVAVIGTLSRLGDAMIRRYLADLGVELHGEAFLFRTRTGSPYRDTTLSHDFARIRASLDPSDNRQLRDMRRGGTMEAFRGGADARTVSQKSGNSLDRSAFLMRTYNPVDLEQVRQADQARIRGRRRNGP